MSKKQFATTFGHRLREARKRIGLPQDQLGVQIGLNETVASARISRYETGIHQPPFETAVHLAKVLGVPLAYFYCEDDDLAELIMGWGAVNTNSRQVLLELLRFQLEVPPED